MTRTRTDPVARTWVDTFAEAVARAATALGEADRKAGDGDFGTYLGTGGYREHIHSSGSASYCAGGFSSAAAAQRARADSDPSILEVYGPGWSIQSA